MQSRLAAIAARSSWVTSFAQNQSCFRQGLASATTSRTADPAVHSVKYEHEPADPSGEPEKSRDVFEPENTRAEVYTSSEETDEAEVRVTKSTQEIEPFAPPRPPYASYPRLESVGVNEPPDPITQRKRNLGTTLLEVSCAGLDGTPWPENEEREESEREGQQKDYQEYYEHHKASPLSQIEVADTRKPITRATDGTAGSEEYGEGREVIGWRPEQLDTAEEALQRAIEIWKQNAMRGDPDAPHSRVLRALRGNHFRKI